MKGKTRDEDIDAGPRIKDRSHTKQKKDADAR